MRFIKEMQHIALELETKHGYCVITPIVENGVGLSKEDLESIAKAHFRKIDISDIVYIVNIGGYIGESVSQEIRYSVAHNKEIVYHEK